MEKDKKREAGQGAELGGKIPLEPSAHGLCLFLSCTGATQAAVHCSGQKVLSTCAVIHLWDLRSFWDDAEAASIPPVFLLCVLSFSLHYFFFFSIQT